jgi:hypothetical protein
MLPFVPSAIQNQLTRACDFITANIRDTYPMFATTKYLAPNSIFFEVQGRDGYFSPKSVTSEATTILSVACFRAWEATNDIRYKNLGINFIDAYANYFYLDNPFTANISQGVNSPYCRSHWLIVGYGSVTTEGLQQGNDPFNFGCFVDNINFVNGIAQVETDLNRVFKIHTGELYYKNLYAPVVNGEKFTIEYWVSNDGFKTFPNGVKQATTEPKGRIKTVLPINGNRSVAYTRASGVTVNPPTNIRQGEGLYEPFPCWFPCKGLPNIEYTSFAFDTAWWAYEAYASAYQHTNDTKYLNAANITKFNTINALNKSQQTYYYQKNSSDNPLKLPGSYLVQTNTSINGQALTKAGYTASRQAGGNKDNWVKLDVNAISTSSSTSFPTMELQNFAAQTIFDPLVSVFVETEVSQSCVLKVKLSTSPDALDFSQEYVYIFPVTANAITSKTINYKQFVKPDLTTWYPWIAEQPVFVFNGASFAIEEVLIKNELQSVVSVNMPNNTTGCGFINAKYTNEIPTIWYSLNGKCDIRIKDNSNNFYTLSLNNTSGEWVQFNASWASFNTTPKLVTEIAFLNTQNSNTNLKIWYAGPTPTPLPSPSIVYKASIVCELKTAFTWWVGDFKPNNNRLDKLKYTAGAAQFVINTLNGADIGYNGEQFYVGYQSPYSLYRWGEQLMSRNVIDLFDDAQEAYTNQSISRISGLLAPVFLPYSPENIPFLDKIKTNIRGAAFPIPFLFDKVVSKDSDAYQFDVFGWEGLDPNTRWAAYTFRAMEDLARYYFANRSDLKAKKVLANFVQFMWDWVQVKGANPITDIPPQIDPQQNYAEPHKWALLGSCFTFCYKARVERTKSWDLIKTAVDYISGQFITTGVMAGMWAKDQPDSVIGGTTYKQFFSFWAGEIIEFLSELLIYQNDLEKLDSDDAIVFPKITCATNNVADYLESYTFDFPIIEHQFADGNTQQVLLDRNPIGDIVGLRFEAMNAADFKLLCEFYDKCKGTNSSFRFDTNDLSYDELDGTWVLMEKPQIESVVHNADYLLVNVVLRVRKIGFL